MKIGTNALYKTAYFFNRPIETTENARTTHEKISSESPRSGIAANNRIAA
jgi:hypothetical protein